MPSTNPSSSQAPSGILVIDKPAGPTSHEIVLALRRRLGISRIGHTGTLDPFASGLLIFCIGKATRLSQFLQAENKRYRGTIRFGFSTDTHDLTGRPTSDTILPCLDHKKIIELFDSFLGETLQVPPMFSAKKIGGKKLYVEARKGLEIPREPARIRIYELKALEIRNDEADFETHCSVGTYIRTLANDMGEKLGCGAHLSKLRRIGIGDIRESHAVSMEEIHASKNPREKIIPLEGIPLGFPKILLTEAEEKSIENGVAVFRDASPTESALPHESKVCLYGQRGFVAIASLRLLDKGFHLKPEIVFHES